MRVPLRSLRVQLAIWLLLPLLLLLALDAWLTYQRAQAAADAAFDRMLLSSARAVAEGVSAHNGQIDVDIPYFALQMFEVNAEGKVFYRVSTLAGRQLTGYEDLPVPPASMRQGYTPHFYNAEYRGTLVRMVALRLPLRDLYTMASADVWVQVAETPESRQELARGILFGALGQEAMLVLLVLAIVLLSVGRGLRPLQRLSALMAARSEADLTPLSDAGLQSELKPLVEALNQYIMRIQRMLAARRRFFADAAHQLKTPLAVMQAQAELALRERDTDQVHGQVRLLLTALRHASHGVRQLLSLSRLEPDSGHLVALEPVDLSAVARATALDLAPIAWRRNVELAFEQRGEAQVDGQAALLQEMISNLIDNASRYAAGESEDAPARVIVEVGAEPAPYLAVIDHGPGIPATEHDKVFQRFYRVAGTLPEGTGLGLPIVREIARLHGAEVELDETAGGGLTVRVRFPAQVKG
jgi:two-component system sensor histidine kinase TctE